MGDQLSLLRISKLYFRHLHLPLPSLMGILSFFFVVVFFTVSFSSVDELLIVWICNWSYVLFTGVVYFNRILVSNFMQLIRRCKMFTKEFKKSFCEVWWHTLAKRWFKLNDISLALLLLLLLFFFFFLLIFLDPLIFKVFSYSFFNAWNISTSEKYLNNLLLICQWFESVDVCCPFLYGL